MRWICPLILLLSAATVLLPSSGLAQDAITVISSDARAQFPTDITFRLEAESASEIVDIALEYRADRRAIVPMSSRVAPDFTPARHVNVSWKWNMLQIGGLPTGTQIDYWWQIEDDAGHRTVTSPQTVSFDDQRYEWDSIQIGKLTFYWYEGDQDFIGELIYAADSALDSLRNDTGVTLDQPATFYVYANSWDLHGALVYPTEWTGGLAFPDYNTVVIGISPYSLEWGKRAVAHELGHLVVHQYVFGPYGVLPTWLDEGLAMDAEGELRADLQELLDQAILSDSLFSVHSISGSFPAGQYEAELSYAESYNLVQFLIDGYGSDKVMELLDAFKDGVNADAALLQVYAFDTDGLGERWRESLGLDPQFPERESGAGHGLTAPYIALFVLVCILLTLTAYLGLLYLRRLQ